MLHNLSLLSLATSILGFVVSILLIFSAEQNRFVNSLLGIGFFALAYRSLTVYALQENIVANTFMMGTVSFIYYLIPPSFYLYFRAVINDEQSLKKRDWLHILPVVLAVLLLIYYLISGYVNSGSLSLPVNESVFYNQTNNFFYVQPGVHAILIFNIAAIYIFLSWKMVFRKLMGNVKEHPQLRKMRNWVLTLLITCSLLILIVFFGGILKIVFDKDIITFVNPHILRSVILIFIFTRVLFKTDLLYGIPDLNTDLPIVDSVPAGIELNEPETITGNVFVEPQQTKNVKKKEENELYFDRFGWIHLNEHDKDFSTPGSIEKDKVIAYINSINRYLETAPYINPEFDIKSISKELQSPLYHIEYLFRYYNRYSFSEFRNNMRVQYVLDNFSEGHLRNFTLEAIGLKAGFNSRSSFFRVFKLVTGKTPKQILDNMVRQ